MKFTIVKSSYNRSIIVLFIAYQNTERPVEVCDYLEKECSLDVFKYRNSSTLRTATIYVHDENMISVEELLNKLRTKYDSGAGGTDTAKAE